MAHGIDVAADVTAEIQCIIDKGVTFVGRYYSQNGGKALSTAEANALRAAGLYIVSVYEDGPTGVSYFNAARGAADAQRAEAQANLVGQPAGTTIYFAIDFDCPALGGLAAVQNYFQAVKTQLGLTGNYQAGSYGSGLVCQHLLQTGLVGRTWLAMSTGWAGYDAFKQSNQWNILQLDEISADYCGLDVDTDLTMGDGGGWI